MKVSEINQLLKDTENRTIGIANNGGLIFGYLLKTYEILSHRSIEKTKRDTDYYTIVLNSGGIRQLVSISRFSKRGRTSYEYSIGPASNI